MHDYRAAFGVWAPLLAAFVGPIACGGPDFVATPDVDAGDDRDNTPIFLPPDKMTPTETDGGDGGDAMVEGGRDLTADSGSEARDEGGADDGLHESGGDAKSEDRDADATIEGGGGGGDARAASGERDATVESGGGDSAINVHLEAAIGDASADASSVGPSGDAIAEAWVDATPSCPSNTFTRCSAMCVDLQNDPSNCGSCGASCVSGQLCVAGACRCNLASCPTGCCSGTQCVTTETALACGTGAAACQQCAAGIACSNRTCLGCGVATMIPGAATGDSFGSAVSAGDATILVGSPSAASGAGTAYVAIQSGSTWPVALIAPSGGSPTASAYGTSVALSGATAMIGGAPNGIPTVWAFAETGISWFPQATITPPTGLAIPPAIALDGNTAVIAGIYSATVYAGSGTSWNSEATLVPSDYIPSATAGIFGYQIAISGDTIVVGGTPVDSSGQNVHWGYVFVRSGATWSQQAKLVPTGLASNSSPQFQFSVAIKGNTAVLATTFGAYVFVRFAGTWTQQPSMPLTPSMPGTAFGASVATNGSAILVGTPNNVGGVGFAYLFGLADGVWTQGAALTSNGAGDGFGSSVALGGATAIVGAPNSGTAGAAFVYTCSP